VVFDWFGSDVVAVVIIEDEQVVVALAGREGQLAGEITATLAGGGSINDCSKQVVGALAFLEGSEKEIRIREQRKSGRRGFGGALVLPGLLEVGLGSGNRVGSVFAEDSRVRPGRTLSSLVAARAASKVDGTGEPREAWEKASSSLIFVG